MPLEIENLSEFAVYCSQKNTEGIENDSIIWAKLNCAEHWGELILNVAAQYGDGVEDTAALGLEYALKPEDSDYGGPIREGDKPRYTNDTVMGAAEILGRFWTHRVPFNRWLKTQVLIEPVTIPASS